MRTAVPEFSKTLQLGDEAATVLLGGDLAAAVKPGDVIALSGDLGAGKTTLARALIRALADDGDLEVPSPTFTLVQAYDETRISVLHYDLYRLDNPEELWEIGFGEEGGSAVALVEWPEKAGDLLPAGTIHVALTHSGDGREAVIRASGDAGARVARSLAIRAFLESAGWGAADRRFLTGDASTRAYETARLGAGTRVVMNAPAMPDGPPVRDGKPYSRIAHLAEDVAPFVAISGELRRQGFAAPEIFSADFAQGLLLIEHLGAAGFLADDGTPVAGRYCAAAELLAAMHARAWPTSIEFAPGRIHRVPAYDREAMSIELDLLASWYAPHAMGGPLSAALKAAFAGGWSTVLDPLASAETSLVLRDFHSPNIIWREEREGFDRLGLIDFQDAVIGPCAYDVASLAQDARVTISPGMEAQIVSAYVAARERVGLFDRAGFETAYAITATQRNSKILGIFVRLNERDGKPAYLRHLPRIRDYVARSLAHPALEPVREFYHIAGIAAADR